MNGTKYQRSPDLSNLLYSDVELLDTQGFFRGPFFVGPTVGDFLEPKNGRVVVSTELKKMQHQLTIYPGKLRFGSDDCPFQLGDFWGSVLIFRGVNQKFQTCRNE